jgi:hypothetical protein
MSFLTKEFLAEQITHHSDRVEAHVLAYARALQMDRPFDVDTNLRAASQHATIFNALSSIAAGK